MSLYEDRFKNHNVHEIIPSTKKRIESFISAAEESEAIDHLTRLLEIANYGKTVLNNTSYIFVSEKILNTLNQILNNINGDLNNYETSQDINQLVNANNRGDNFLSNLRQLTQPYEPSDFKNFAESLEEYHKSIDGVLTTINKRKNSLEKQINNLSSRIEQFNSTLDQHNQTLEKQKGRLDTAINNFQAQFSEAEDRRRENFENTTNTRNQEFQEFRQNKTDEINSFLDEKQKEITQTISNYSEKTEKNIADVDKAANELIEEQKANAKNTIEFLEQTRDEAAKLLNVVSNVTVTGNYKEIANSERATANWLRILAIIFMIAGIAVIAEVVFNISKIGFNWKLLLSRVGVTIVILIPAFYLVKESANHRQNEIRNRKMELELASINPYLELMPDKERIELKAKLTEKFFGQPDSVFDPKQTVTASSIFELLEKVLLNFSKRFKL